MFALKRINPPALAGLSIALTIGLLSVGASMAQVGPMQPAEQPPVQTPVTKAVDYFKHKRANKKANEEPAYAVKPNPDTSDSQPQAKPQVVDPAADPNDSGRRQYNPGQPPQFGGGQMSPVDTHHAPLLTQPPLDNAKVDDPQLDSKNPPPMNHPKLDDPNNPLGFTDAEIRLKKYTGLIDAHRYADARPGLVQLRQTLIDMTEAHINLFKTLNQIPSARAQAELEKELALQFAQQRDRAMMQMARIYISDKDYSHAIKELTQVIQSQPRSKAGLRSYEMLQEIGFTEKLQLAE